MNYFRIYIFIMQDEKVIRFWYDEIFEAQNLAGIYNIQAHKTFITTLVKFTEIKTIWSS